MENDDLPIHFLPNGGFPQTAGKTEGGMQPCIFSTLEILLLFLRKNFVKVLIPFIGVRNLI
jgi:hypothetical protein